MILNLFYNQYGTRSILVIKQGLLIKIIFLLDVEPVPY